MNRPIATAALALCLGGCAVMPELRSVSSAPETTTDVRPALQLAGALEADYTGFYNRSVRHSGVLNLPTILAAAGAATVLIADPRGASEIAGYIGVAAGAYAAGRNSFVPAGLPGLYVSGVAALSCIRGEAGLFVPNTPEKAADPATFTPLESLNVALANLLARIPGAERLERTAIINPVGTPVTAAGGRLREQQLLQAKATLEAQTRVYEAAQADKQRLTDLLVRARKLAADAQLDAAAADTAGSVFLSAVNAVQIKVATKGAEGRVVDYKTLAQQFAPPAPAEGMDGDSGEATGLDFQAGALADELEALSQAMQQVQAALRPYGAALDRVRVCPNGI